MSEFQKLDSPRLKCESYLIGRIGDFLRPHYCDKKARWSYRHVILCGEHKSELDKKLRV